MKVMTPTKSPDRAGLCRVSLVLSGSTLLNWPGTYRFVYTGSHNLQDSHQSWWGDSGSSGGFAWSWRKSECRKTDFVLRTLHIYARKMSI